MSFYKFAVMLVTRMRHSDVISWLMFTKQKKGFFSLQETERYSVDRNFLYRVFSCSNHLHAPCKTGDMTFDKLSMTH